MNTSQLTHFTTWLLLCTLCGLGIADDHETSNVFAFYHISLEAPLGRAEFQRVRSGWHLDKNFVLRGVDSMHSVRGVAFEYTYDKYHAIRWVEDERVYELSVRIAEGNISGVIVDLSFRVYSDGQPSGGTAMGGFPLLDLLGQDLIILPSLLKSLEVEEVYAIAIRKEGGGRGGVGVSPKAPMRRSGDSEVGEEAGKADGE